MIFLSAFSYMCFFYPLQKTDCFLLVQCMGEGSRVVNRLPSRGMQRGPSKGSGLQRLLVMLEGEPFEEILAQPTWGLPACRGGSTAHLSS